MIARLRSLLFWMHLAAGVIAGVVILTMCVTGAVLALEHAVLERADPGVVSPPDGATPLAVDDLLARVREAKPGADPTMITLSSEAGALALVRMGRETVHVDPWTGDVRPLGAPRVRAFFDFNEDLHRVVAMRDRRPIGKMVTGVCNLAFLFLALSGALIWIPRTGKAIARATWFERGLRGKARDWNWHNVIGIWCAPVLVVLTVSASVISFEWATNLVYTITGSAKPAPGGNTVAIDAPEEGAARLSLQAQLDAALAASRPWESVTLRLGGKPGTATSFQVRETDRALGFTSTTVSVDPYRGTVASTETFAQQNLGRRVRTWLRYLHTGEALGGPGQLIAAVASLGGAVLVYTGIALSLRRFAAWLGRRRRNASPAGAASSVSS